MTDKNEEITHEITINGAENTDIKSEQKQKINLAERLRWLKARGVFKIRNMKCNCFTAKRVKRRKTSKSKDTITSETHIKGTNGNE